MKTKFNLKGNGKKLQVLWCCDVIYLTSVSLLAVTQPPRMLSQTEFTDVIKVWSLDKLDINVIKIFVQFVAC